MQFKIQFLYYKTLNSQMLWVHISPLELSHFERCSKFHTCTRENKSCRTVMRVWGTNECFTVSSEGPHLQANALIVIKDPHAQNSYSSSCSPYVDSLEPQSIMVLNGVVAASPEENSQGGREILGCTPSGKRGETLLTSCELSVCCTSWTRRTALYWV